MRTSLAKLKEEHPLITSFIISGLWIGIMLLTSLLLSSIPYIIESNNEYLAQFFVDFVGTAFGIGLISFFGYNYVFKEKKYGLGKGVVTGMYFIVIGCLAIIISIYGIFFNSLMTGAETLMSFRPASYIITFTITMFLIGTAEEFAFRGVISNILIEKYGKSSAGVWFSTIMTGVVFGAMHIFNALNPHISLSSALVQAIGAGTIGMALTAIYYRSRSIWLVVFLHAFIDFGALFSSGVLETDSSMASTIGGYSFLNLIGAVPYVIVLLVLLRKSKMKEIIGEDAPKSTRKEKTRLRVTVSALVIITMITFISGLRDSLQPSGNVITSFSGTFINQDMVDEIEVPLDATYEIEMGALNVTEGCIVDQYLQDSEGDIFCRHLMDSGVGSFQEYMPAGEYTFYSIVISSLDEFEDYIKETEYRLSDQAFEELSELLGNTTPEMESVDVSFSLTQIGD